MPERAGFAREPPPVRGPLAGRQPPAANRVP